MKVAEHIAGDVLTMSLAGHLNAAGAETLETRLLKTTRDGARWILLDCSRLYSIDSIGLRAVLQNTRRLSALGGALALCGLPESIQQILDVSGFTQACRISLNPSAGVEALSAEAQRLPQAGVERSLSSGTSN